LAAASGDNYLVFDRVNFSGANVSMLFPRFEGDAFRAGEFEELTIEFSIWMDDGFTSLANWGFTSGQSPFNNSAIFNWAGIGGDDNPDPRRLWDYTGSAWAQTAFADGQWTPAEWNRVVMTMRAVDNAAVVSVQVNDGDAVDTVVWGNLDNILNQVYMRAGFGTDLFFVDDILVSGTIQERMCPSNPNPPDDLSGEIVFSDGFENSALGEAPGAEDPDIGGYETNGNVMVVSGQYEAQDGAVVGPSVANSGNNYLAVDRLTHDSGENIRALFAGDGFTPAEYRTIRARFYLWLRKDELSYASYGLGSGTAFNPETLFHWDTIGGPNDAGTGNDKDYQAYTGAAWEYHDISADYAGGVPADRVGWNLVACRFSGGRTDRWQ